nr:MAG TPA: hypothetical protein [Caudoviricetes sp.]
MSFLLRAGRYGTASESLLETLLLRPQPLHPSTARAAE